MYAVDMYDTMLRRAAERGPRGIACCIPVEPYQPEDTDYVITVFMFYGETDGERRSNVLAVNGCLTAERLARERGAIPRVSAW